MGDHSDPRTLSWGTARRWLITELPAELQMWMRKWKDPHPSVWQANAKTQRMQHGVRTFCITNWQTTVYRDGWVQNFTSIGVTFVAIVQKSIAAKTDPSKPGCTARTFRRVCSPERDSRKDWVATGTPDAPAIPWLHKRFYISIEEENPENSHRKWLSSHGPFWVTRTVVSTCGSRGLPTNWAPGQPCPLSRLSSFAPFSHHCWEGSTY